MPNGSKNPWQRAADSSCSGCTWDQWPSRQQCSSEFRQYALASANARFSPDHLSAIAKPVRVTRDKHQPTAMKPNCLRACLGYRRWRYHLGCLASSGAKLGTLKIPFLYGGLQQDTEWGQAADLRIAGMLMLEQSMPLLEVNCLRPLYYTSGWQLLLSGNHRSPWKWNRQSVWETGPAWPSAAQPPVSLLLAKFVLCHISTTYNLMVIT